MNNIKVYNWAGTLVGSYSMSYKDYEMEIGDLKGQIEDLQHELSRVAELATQSTRKLLTAKAALKQYGDESFYDYDFSLETGGYSQATMDCGEIARAALDEITTI